MPWLEDLKFPRGYQMGTHKLLLSNKEILNIEVEKKKKLFGFFGR